MSSLLAFLSYGIAVAVAFYLNSGQRMLRWYWYAVSVLCALGIGLMRFPTRWAGPVFDIAIGSAFVFLFTFGLVGLIARIFGAHEDGRENPRQKHA